MAQHFFSLTMLVNPERATEPVRSISDMPDGMQEGLVQGDKELHCLTNSRNGWLSTFIQRTLEGYPVHGLHYLLSDGVILRGQEIGVAITGIERLLQAFRVDPGVFLAGMYIGSTREISKTELAMVPTELSKAPAIPRPEGRYEDGEDWPYLIGFLRSHQVVLRAAQERALWVVYAQGF